MSVSVSAAEGIVISGHGELRRYVCKKTVDDKLEGRGRAYAALRTRDHVSLITGPFSQVSENVVESLKWGDVCQRRSELMISDCHQDGQVEVMDLIMTKRLCFEHVYKYTYHYS